MAGMLVMRDVSAGYGGVAVLRRCNLALRAGESVALLGPNGGGKTTMLRCISGVLPPSSGEVIIMGRNARNLPARRLARHVAVVPQRAEYPARLSVREMVLLGRYPWLSWLGGYTAGDRLAADRAMRLTGVERLAKRQMGELSGGEAQRVLLARALAQQSPLLLLDELSAGLDLAHMIEIFDLLERQRQDGHGLIMALHDCNLAALYATRLVGLKGGQVLFDGPTRETFTRENLSELYDTPILVAPHPLLEVPQAFPAHAGGPFSGGARDRLARFGAGAAAH